MDAPLLAVIEIADAQAHTASSPKAIDLFVVEPLATPAQKFGRAQIVGATFAGASVVVVKISLTPQMVRVVLTAVEFAPLDV